MSHNNYREHEDGKNVLPIYGAVDAEETKASSDAEIEEEQSDASNEGQSKETEPQSPSENLQDISAQENNIEDEDDEKYFADEVQYTESDKRQNPVIARLLEVRKALTVDFEKPLRVSDQLIIMGVILTISIILFFFLYITASIVNHSDTEEESSAVLSEETSTAPADENSNTGSQQSREASDKTNKTSGMSETSKPKKSEASKKEVSYDIEMDTVEIDNDNIHYGYQVLVNKECQCFYEGENIVSLIDTRSSSYDITDDTVGLDENIIDKVNSMLDDFSDIYGNTDIMMACGYRSYELQVQLYNDEVEAYGEEQADLWVAPPGFSEHQTGFAFDLNLNDDSGIAGIHYDGAGNYSWINENCCKYGFIIRYPQGKVDITGIEYEPWHFRYVGPAAAQYISENEMTLEEYLDIVHTYSPEKPLYISGDDGREWCVYYIEESGYDYTELTVPKDLNYEISGDNYSGYIITAEVSSD